MTIPTLLTLLAIGHLALSGAVVIRHREAQLVLAAVAAVLGLIVLLVSLTR